MGVLSYNESSYQMKYMVDGIQEGEEAGIWIDDALRVSAYMEDGVGQIQLEGDELGEGIHEVVLKASNSDMLSASVQYQVVK